MARSRVYRRKSHHKRKGSKRPRTRRNRSRSQRGGGYDDNTCQKFIEFDNKTKAISKMNDTDAREMMYQITGVGQSCAELSRRLNAQLEVGNGMF